MATPAFLRYLPARLKPLGSPAVWAPLTVFTLLSIFIWEYYKNPNWFNRPQISNINPNSNLTAEEQARLSEIDTLDLLLRNARTPQGEEDLSTSLISPINPGAAAEENSTIAPDRTLAGKDNPFGVYEEQYKFPGSGSTTAVRTARPEASSLSLGAGSATGATAPSPGSSALSEALDRQQSARNGSRDNAGERMPTVSTGSTLPSQGSFQLGTQSSNTPSVAGNAGNSTVGNANAGNNAGSIVVPASGNNRISSPFIPTTPDMSPPVGTTGYQVPSSANLPVFNAPPQQPTRNPLSQSFRVPAPNTAAPAPAAATTPTIDYTAPSFTQPAQNRRRP